MRQGLIILPAFLLFVLTGCSGTYYKTMEAFGYHKRDILVDRVAEARDAQQDARQDFTSALDHFNDLLGRPETELKQKYDKLNAEYEKCADDATAVRKRISDVENVASALFKEWRTELDEYTSNKLRAASERKLIETQDRYQTLITAMKKAADRMDPVLAAFHDQVLFLKHNLNAQAVASLQDELISVESSVEELVKQMEDAIKEADAFIASMSNESQ